MTNLTWKAIDETIDYIRKNYRSPKHCIVSIDVIRLMMIACGSNILVYKNISFHVDTKIKNNLIRFPFYEKGAQNAKKIIFEILTNEERIIKDIIE